ncbi:clostripain-related cysteine peptidase [Butyrivibrio sp. VCB2006]|uniref:clostripain-related cysteine peptidase n=1 Tax=Butyrivibrio sp. VCB2006 TaxID=1280679 RepID=UPI000414F9A3|nr:clostripain-related cysteine peptidase [Butyrivibrio sp. VCB2006]
MENRPVGRKKNVGTGGSGVHRRGDGLGTGPVGSTNGYSGSSSGNGNDGGMKRSGGRSPLFMIIIVLFLLLGGGGGLTSLLGGGGTDTVSYTETAPQTTTQTTTTSSQSQTTTGFSNGYDGSMLSLFGSMLGGGSGSYSGGSMASASWSDTPNTGKLNTSVASAARAKRTVIKGNGQDTITIMVYMCGADLESRGGMASKDIQEMLAAKFDDKINLILYTGGAKQWQNNVISSSTNQIYQVKDGKLICLRDNLGSVPMTKADTLSGFIKWGASNFPADRYDFIFWNHGGGSTGGYGYDEKFSSAGAMSLAGINTALKDGGVTFDFVGFDTCLMATVENALVVSNYADYLVASEETEPGVGWYYTSWLSALGSNTSMETTEIGKNIIDAFTNACAQSCPGQKTTLSLIDLAELSQTVPAELADFSKNTSEMITSDYATVSNARSSTREFATSSRIDQVDLVDLANRIGTDEAKELAEALKGAIKYNRTSSNMTNAYGLSIYFPYQKASKVDSMVGTYEAIGMDENYAKCIQNFAAMGVGGQAAAGGTGSPMASLFGTPTTSSAGTTSAGGSVSSDMLMQLLSGFLTSDMSSISGLTSSNSSFLGKSLDVDQASSYIAEHHFDPTALVWAPNAEDYTCISLTEDQWKLVNDLKLHMFYDDGEGYVDLGMDTTFEFDEDGNLLAPDDKTWLAIDGQIVAFYVEDIQGDENSYAITGRVPCLLNGDRANLIIVFNSENEDGFVAGAVYDYVNGETETVAKSLTEIQEGDTIDYVCDFYDYNQNYQDSYFLGEQVTVDKPVSEMVINNLPVGDGKTVVMYCFTDIYGEEYWTPALEY